MSRTPLDLFALAIDTIVRAKEYSFDSVPAFDAAQDLLAAARLSPNELRDVAASIAMLAAVEMTPHGRSMDVWTELHTWVLAQRERES